MPQKVSGSPQQHEYNLSKRWNVTKYKYFVTVLFTFTPYIFYTNICTFYSLHYVNSWICFSFFSEEIFSEQHKFSKVERKSFPNLFSKVLSKHFRKKVYKDCEKISCHKFQKVEKIFILKRFRPSLI